MINSSQKENIYANVTAYLVSRALAGIFAL
jgi:hypothetical protein